MFPILPIRGLAVFLASWKLFDVSFPEPRIGAPTWRHLEQVACADLGAIDTAHRLSLVRRMGTYALALDRLDAGYVLLRRLRRQDETTMSDDVHEVPEWKLKGYPEVQKAKPKVCGSSQVLFIDRGQISQSWALVLKVLVSHMRQCFDRVNPNATSTKIITKPFLIRLVSSG